jgi:hypothetical protein
VRRDESSPIVTEPRAERTDPHGTADSQRDRLALADAGPTTSADALKLAVKLALDEGDLDGAAMLLDVARKTRPRPLVHLEAVRRRDDGEGTG